MKLQRRSTAVSDRDAGTLVGGCNRGKIRLSSSDAVTMMALLKN
jgi:hypothetical protein